MAKRLHVLAWLFGMFLQAGCGAGDVDGRDGEVLRLGDARFLQDATATPPRADDPRWLHVRLPDRWDDRRPGQGGFGWYRFEVPGPRGEDERLALSLAGVNMNAEAFANGVPIGSGGSMQEPISRNSNRPLLWSFPGALLDAERNALAVRLFAYPNDVGSLGSVAFGSEAELRPEYQRRHFLQIELTQTTSALVLMLSVFFGVLWLGAGRDPVYGWFALSAGAWSFVSLNYWVQDPGVAHWSWVRLFYFALGTFAVTLPIWAHRLLGLRRRGIERLLFAALAGYALLAASLPDTHYWRVVTPFQASWLAFGSYGVFVLVRGWRSFSRGEALVYVTGGLVCTGLAVAEQLDALGLGGGWRPHLLPYIGSVLVLCLATTLGVRFAKSLEDARRSNRELEARVRAKSLELTDNHTRLRALERGQVLAEERGRIMREMHDGIGGQLVATLAMVQAGDSEPREIAHALRDALDDMRSVIDSMDPLVDDLNKLLGSLRARFEALLRRNDRSFLWNVGALPPTPWLGPEQYLHILRILQEAIANALKHADPGELEVSVEFVESPSPGLRISVRDDGVRVASPTGHGRGLTHMQLRAESLGGSLRIVRLDPGTRVELWLPAPAKNGNEED